MKFIKHLAVALAAVAFAAQSPALQAQDDEKKEETTATERGARAGREGREGRQGRGGNPMDAKDKTITEVVTSFERFSTLGAAVKAAGLEEALGGTDEVTIFVPPNRSFEEFGKAKVDDLLKPENKEKLAKVLKHHVLKGKKTAADIGGATELETLAGTKLKVEKDGETVKVGGSTIRRADIEAKNGMIHVIDAVLVPAE